MWLRCLRLEMHRKLPENFCSENGKGRESGDKRGSVGRGNRVRGERELDLVVFKPLGLYNASL